MNGYRLEELERYDQMLDDCHADAEICGLKYAPSRALRLVDPIAYRCGLSDWLSALAEDGLYCHDKELFSDEDGFDDEGEEE